MISDSFNCREARGDAAVQGRAQGLKLLPIDFDKQLLPGTFEHALCYLVDHELDLSDFHARYRNSK